MKMKMGNGIGKVLEAMDKQQALQERDIISQAQSFSKEKKDEMIRKAEKDNQELFELEKGNITREMRRGEEKVIEAHILGLVEAKEAFVDEVWAFAEKKFLSMPKRKKEYRLFMRRILESVKDLKDYMLYVRKEDLKLHKGAKKERISGGVILRSKDGKIEIDYSLEGIAKRHSQETKARISEVLFG